MTRKKVKLAFIPNDSARKATFKKRKKGFLKKMYELTTLCEIEACAVIYSPYDAQPEAWPSAIGAQRVLSKFRRMPEMEKSKKMVNQEAFLRQRINKAAEQLKKQQKENREKEITQVMHHCLGGKASVQNMNLVDLNDLGWLIDQNLKEIYKRIETLKKQPAAPPKAAKRAAVVEAALPPPPAAVPPQREQVRAVNEGEKIQQCVRTPPGFDQVNLLDNQDPLPIRGSWFMELMSPHDSLVGGFGGGAGGGSLAGDNMPMTFADYSTHNLNSLWSNPFFP
ncbi:hypothetical protein V2J09_019599 [Rumex salicifolius]